MGRRGQSVSALPPMPIIFATGQFAVASLTKADNAVPEVKAPVITPPPTAPKKRRGRPAKQI
jgi:hypothetical protein